MIRRLLAAAMMISALMVSAQNTSSYELSLIARNGLTQEMVDAVYVITTLDSVPVDSIANGHMYITDGRGSTIENLTPGRMTVKVVPGSEMLICVRAEGYDTEYFPITFPTGNIRSIDLNDLKMYRTSTIELGEVTVRHSRVKMVMKGDTIVFDAAKFQLAHGDMLSAMIRQMEGLEIKDGVIFMNGKQVDDLLINGQSFFKGDPSVALNNLPAFTVRNIKIYEKDADDAYITGVTAAKRDYVLDVQLKREYVSGYLGNVEGGYGTAGRYMGRAFGIGFGSNFRMALYGNFNNIQNAQIATASSNGSWNGWGSNGGPGDSDRQLTGIDYTYNPRKDVRLNGSVNFKRMTGISDVLTSTTNFLETGNTYGRSAAGSNNRDLSLDVNNRVQITRKKVFVEFWENLNYSHNNSNLMDRTGLYISEPGESYRGQAVDSLFATPSQRWVNDLLYKVSNGQLGRNDRLNLSLNGNSRIKFDEQSADYLTVAAWAKFDRTNALGRQQYALNYAPGTMAADDAFDRLNRNDPHNWQYEGCVAYDFKSAPNRWDGVFSMRPYVSFNNLSATADNRYYRLDGIDFSGEGLSIALNDAIRAAIDRQNSYWSHENKSVGMGRLELEYATSSRVLVVQMTAAGRYNRSVLDYNRPGFFQQARQNGWTPQYRLFIGAQKNGHYTSRNVTLNFTYQRDLPNTVYRINTLNNLDPLNIQLNNPDLSNPGTFHFNTNGYMSFKGKGLSFGYYASGDFYLDRTVMSRIYDPATGVTTRRPVSINGSHDIYMQVYTYFPVVAGITGSVMFTAQTERDIDMLTDASWHGRNIVHRNTLRPAFNLGYSEHNLSVSINTSYGTTRSSSDRPGYADYTIHEWPVKFNVSYTFPWRMTVNSNLESRRRSGYTDPSMNNTTVRWGLRLSQDIATSWTLTLIASDLLNQRRNIMSSQSATDIRETWQYEMPRYFMATLSYKFNITPGSKK